MKLCTMCRSPDGPFALKSGEAGLRGELLARCRPCQRVAVKNSKAKNPNKVAEYNRKWWANNPEKRELYAANYVPNPESQAASVARYRENNRAKINAYARLYSKIHRGERRAYAQKWRANNRDRYNARKRESYVGTGRASRLAHAQNRRARLRLAGGNVTPEQWREILDNFDNRCAYCFAALARSTMDHVIPLSRGGKHEASNVVPACKTCNCSKNAKPLAQWLDLPILCDTKIIAKAA
jgi:5-methylcytosine-specific restriction endonuclease McrA